jgi:hypothetical protein
LLLVTEILFECCSVSVRLQALRKKGGKMKKICVALSVLCFLFISPAASGGEEIIYSETFTRGTGAPVTAFAIFAGNTGPATISVTNGGSGQNIEKRVSGPIIKLNGETIFGPSDINKNVASLEKGVSLDGSNVLEVLLKGRAGGEIGIQVKQSVLTSLTVLMDGAGSGRVTSSPDGIFCETDCLEAYGSGTLVTLSASPYSGSTFAGWSGGGCSGTGTCTLTIGGITSVTATFDLSASAPFALVTPYVFEDDMRVIRNSFNSQHRDEPWGEVHDGLDIYPVGDDKPFQAACSGRVQRVVTFIGGVAVIIACDPPYTIEYTFEPQAPDTEQIQRENILVDEGDPVTQGEIIGTLYAADLTLAHVHFTLDENAIPICPEPYFSPADISFIETLIGVARPDPDDVYICAGGNPDPPDLVTPFVNESDMKEINVGFSSEHSTSPWGFVHGGIDIYPQGNLKPFQAACEGVVDSVELRRSETGANWEVGVLIQCDEYVEDLNNGGYFIPFSIDYVFEPMSDKHKDGQAQLDNLEVVEGQQILQDDPIGNLHVAAPGESHLHFGLVQYGSSAFQALGITGIPICPEPHFSAAANTSILNLLHAAWPSAGMCYQE